MGTPGLKITEKDEATVLAERQEKVRTALGVTSLDNTFANWKHRPGTDLAYISFLALATRDDCRPFLLCYGGVGNGKTYLMEAAVNELYQRGKFARVNTFVSMVQTLRAHMKPGPGQSPLDWILNNYKISKNLFIDDVGMGGSGSAWEYGLLEEIVCYRYAENLAGKGLITAIATNRDLKELPERVVSRFMDTNVGFCVLNEGEDFRRLPAEERR